MPSHQERIKAKNPEMNCKHLFIFVTDSDKAPFIEKNGDRTTIKSCINCGLRLSYTRTQEEFEEELKRMFPKWDKNIADLSHLKSDMKRLLDEL